MSKEKTEPKRPTHAIYQAIGTGDKTRWSRIGAGWENKDGKGMNLVFDSFPLSGRTVIREITDQEGSGGQQ